MFSFTLLPTKTQKAPSGVWGDSSKKVTKVTPKMYFIRWHRFPFLNFFQLFKEYLTIDKYESNTFLYRVDLLLKTIFICDKHITGFAALCRANNTRSLELIHQSSGTVITDRKFTLNQRSRTLLMHHD